MKKTMRLTVLAGILLLTSWVSPGAATIPSCPNGYPACSVFSGRACSTTAICCLSGLRYFCICQNGVYINC